MDSNQFESKIINGKFHAQTLLIKVQSAVEKLLEKKNIVPKLVILMVGNNSASAVYVRNKINKASEVGIKAELIHLQSDYQESEIIDFIKRCNQDACVHGIIVQLPLPPSINQAKVIQAIDPRKDVDGLHPINMGYLALGINQGFIPCTPLGCMYVLQATIGEICGKHVVVVGRSNIVGRPLSVLLLKNNATVTICHSNTIGLANITSAADVVITAIGKPKFFTRDYFSAKSVVIDVGISQIVLTDINGTSKYKLTGDVDFVDVAPLVSYITPVPYGIGPMTVAYLLANTTKAAAISCNEPICVDLYL